MRFVCTPEELLQEQCKKCNYAVLTVFSIFWFEFKCMLTCSDILNSYAHLHIFVCAVHIPFAMSVLFAVFVHHIHSICSHMHNVYETFMLSHGGCI